MGSYAWLVAQPSRPFAGRRWSWLDWTDLPDAHVEQLVLAMPF